MSALTGLAAAAGDLAPVVGHLGALHPVEKGLTLVLAFGPFAVLGVVVAVRRRQDEAEERAEAARRAAPPGEPGGPGGPGADGHPT